MSGILTTDGRFFHVSANYGLHLSKLHAAVKAIKPDVDFPTRVSLKVQGPLSSNGQKVKD